MRELDFLNLLISENSHFQRTEELAFLDCDYRETINSPLTIPPCPNVEGLDPDQWRTYQSWVSDLFKQMIIDYRGGNGTKKQVKRWGMHLTLLRKHVPINLLFYVNLGTENRKALLKESLEGRNKLIRKAIKSLEASSEWIERLNPSQIYHETNISEVELDDYELWERENIKDSWTEEEISSLPLRPQRFTSAENQALRGIKQTLSYYKTELYAGKQVTHTRLFPLLLEKLFLAFQDQGTKTTAADKAIAMLLIALGYEVKNVDNLTTTVRNWKTDIFDWQRQIKKR